MIKLLEQVSGKSFFLFCASPCAEERKYLELDPISQQDFDDLVWYLEEKMEPDIKLLERCFPKAVAGLKKAAREICLPHAGDQAIVSEKEIWCSSTVEEYWLRYHGYPNGCPMKVGKVVGALGTNFIGVDDGNTFLLCFNHRKLRLEKGDQVLVHHNGVVMKVEQSVIAG